MRAVPVGFRLKPCPSARALSGVELNIIHQKHGKPRCGDRIRPQARVQYRAGATMTASLYCSCCEQCGWRRRHWQVDRKVNGEKPNQIKPIMAFDRRRGRPMALPMALDRGAAKLEAARLWTRSGSAMAQKTSKYRPFSGRNVRVIGGVCWAWTRDLRTLSNGGDGVPSARRTAFDVTDSVSGKCEN